MSRLEQSALPLAIAILVAAGGARGDEPFEWREVPSAGRTVAVDTADLDGDGRPDLLEFAYLGVPPDEQRLLRVRYRRSDGALPEAPDQVLTLPPETAAYDLADLPDDPGEQLLLLRPSGLSVLSFGGRQLGQRELHLPEAPSLGAARDERGLDRLQLAYRGLMPGLVLLIPRFGKTVITDPDGKVLARLRVGGWANYLVPSGTLPLITESGIEVYFDAPRLTIGDADGDGRADVLAATRREIRLFLQRPDDSFAEEPDRILVLKPASEQDHVRGTGQVRIGAADLDGDGRLDLLVSRTSGGLTDARAHATVHLGRSGGWDLEQPDQEIGEDDGWGGDQLTDLDGDGLPELIHVRMPLSILELVEMLVTRSMDVEFSIYRSRAGGVFEAKPWAKRKLDLPFSFETLRPSGFMPSFSADLNQDGYPDLVTSRGGSAIEVYLGGSEAPYRKRVARQDVDTRGRLKIGDVDGDRFPDLLIYEPSLPDVPIRIARNRGTLPGSPAPLPAVGDAEGR